MRIGHPTIGPGRRARPGAGLPGRGLEGGQRGRVRLVVLVLGGKHASREMQVWIGFAGSYFSNYDFLEFRRGTRTNSLLPLIIRRAHISQTDPFRRPRPPPKAGPEEMMVILSVYSNYFFKLLTNTFLVNMFTKFSFNVSF